MLFEEDEVILEEEEVVVENISIKPVKVMKDESVNQRTFEDTVEIKAVEEAIIDIQEPVIIPEPVEDKSGTPKKSFRIDLDETVEKRPKPVIPVYEKEEDTYRPKSILSPMHGGSETEEDIIVQTVNTKKKHAPVTQIISPMYGNVAKEEDHAEKLSEEMMDIDIMKMIKDEESDDEVQTSLFDFLEGLDENES